MGRPTHITISMKQDGQEIGPFGAVDAKDVLRRFTDIIETIEQWVCDPKERNRPPLSIAFELTDGHIVVIAENELGITVNVTHAQ